MTSENERDCVWCASGRTQCPKHEPLAEYLRREAPFSPGGHLPDRFLRPAAADFNDLANELRLPNLGLATTRLLLEELEARYRIGLVGLAGKPTDYETGLAKILMGVLNSSTAEQLAYRPADNG